jgi:hypothetical protein
MSRPLVDQHGTPLVVCRCGCCYPHALVDCLLDAALLLGVAAVVLAIDRRLGASPASAERSDQLHRRGT